MIERIVDRPQTVLVTGCAGFIGRALVCELVGSGFSVVGLDRICPPKDLPIERFIQVDLCDPESANVVFRKVRDVGAIFHLAAARADWGLSSNDYYNDNVVATESVIQLCRKANIGDVLHYSTVGVLPRTQTALSETDVPSPETDYGRTKLSAEQKIKEATKSGDLKRGMVLRPSAVFGRMQPPNTNIYRLIEAIRKKRFVMVGKGDVTKTTSYIDNTIAATLWIYNYSRNGYGIWHYVDEPKLTTAQLVGMISAVLGISPPRINVPLRLAYAIGQFGDLTAYACNKDIPITSRRIMKFCTPTNFSAQKIVQAGFRAPVSIDQAVRDTVEWQCGIHGQARRRT